MDKVQRGAQRRDVAAQAAELQIICLFRKGIKRLDIAYVAEGKPEIPIRIYKNVLQENPEDNSTDYGFKILQKLPENQEETEACRLRLRTIPLMP